MQIVPPGQSNPRLYVVAGICGAVVMLIYAADEFALIQINVFLLTAMAIPPIVLIVALYRKGLSRHKINHPMGAIYPACGYNLRGIPVRNEVLECPECGLIQACTQRRKNQD